MATTITSLLNSLHTHLQSQTQLLPTLHNQLGLPPTSLTDDLAALQKQLTECIESQIDLRRKQVDEWMCKCEEVESQCIRYGKALGGHVKATGSSVGEIRKEQVLPRRYDMITEYQEKLRQLYHTKLEQLLTLTNRLIVLSRTLGPEFFPEDILEPLIGPGESENDSEPRRDVTPERFSRLEKELVRGKGEVGKRLHHLSLTLIQIDFLHSELGIIPPSPDDIPTSASLSGSSITRPTSSCSMLTASSTSSDPFLMSTRVSTPTPSTRGKATTPFLLVTDDAPPAYEPEGEYQRVFARFTLRMEELSDEEVSDPNKPTVGLEGVDPTPGLIGWAENLRSHLEDLKRRREAHIQTMYDQLEALWRRLGVSDAEMDAFVDAHRGSTEEVIREYEEELDRMLELKRERMSTFVENARAEIVKLWDDLMVGEEERADFAPFADDEHTEELLSIHEEEIRRLKEERRLKGSLLTSIRKYFDILAEEKELAAAAADQTRLLGRGPRDPGRLLREEKMRKRVTKEKPRLEQDLLISIPAWEAETGRNFLVNGESILHILNEACNAHEKENAAKRKPRAGSVPPRSKTPSNPVNNHAAGPSTVGPSKSSMVTPAIRPGSSLAGSRTAPNKKPKLGEATAAYNNALPVPLIITTNMRTTARPPSPSSRIPSMPSKTSITTSSSLPRPIAMPVPKHAGAALGHGRVPSVPHHSHSYHPYPQVQRATSASAMTSGYGVLGAAGMGRTSAASTARKASRARRESFKPRPSMDDDWAAAPPGGDRRFAGFAGGAVREEEEDF